MEVFAKKGRVFRARPPWPAGIASAKGELPEFVQVTRAGEEGVKWAAASGDLPAWGGVLYRARVDLELVVDGKVIDVKRIRFPSDGPTVVRP